MYKKLLAFAATAIISASASAGYVQYDFVAPSSYGQSGVSGYFIQRDDDKSIAYFQIRLNDYANNFGLSLQPAWDEGGTWITYATTHYRGDGPTSFSIGDNEGLDHDAHFNIEFSPAADGKFSYLATASYQSMTDGIGAYWSTPKRTGAAVGLITEGSVLPGMADELDMMGGTYRGFPRVVPAYTNFVPEPASLGLLAIGILGAGIARRRKLIR